MKHALYILAILATWNVSGLYHTEKDVMRLSEAYNEGVEHVCGPMRVYNYNFAMVYCEK